MSVLHRPPGAREEATSPAASQARRPKSRRFAQLRLHGANISYLTIKEFYGILADPIMLLLVAYSFTVAVYAVATGAKTEATNLSIGFVDEDHSELSRQIADGLTPPTFAQVVEIGPADIDRSMNAQRFTFVIEIPPKFQSDIVAGRQASAQIDIDATAIAIAFNGMTYIQHVITNYVMEFKARSEARMDVPVKFVTRAKFNPNYYSSWFTSVMQVINNVTMLTVILTGAALIRERETGTVEHLLVMPVVPPEIMLSKMLANGTLVLVAAGLSLQIVVQWVLQVPVAGSTLLFLFGACFYVFTVAALGILLATIAATMGQLGLLSIPVLLVMMLLSGGTTPLESMPVWLKDLMMVISPTPHFVIFAQDVLYRGADFSIVWPEILASAVIGAVYFVFALRRFRRVIFGS